MIFDFPVFMYKTTYNNYWIMMKTNLFLSIVIASVLMMTSCSSSDNAGTTTEIQKTEKPLIRINLTSEQQQYVCKTNDFAFHLTATVGKSADKYVLLSPLSAAYVLGMLENGASGNTRSQITSVLGFGGNDDAAVNDYFNRLLTGAPKVDEDVKICIANAIIADHKFPLNADFVNTVSNAYQANLKNMNFAADDVVGEVNNWASDHTNGMIKNILDRVSDDACMYAMNAIYFKGTWKDEFDEKKTQRETFTAEDGSKTNVDMMHRADYLLYASNDNYSIVELPYGNGGYRMMLLLPADGKSLNDVLTSLDGTNWRETLDNMRDYDVDLKVPKFSMEYKITMNDALQTLGITDAFDENKADFTRMSNRSSYLSRVIQKCRMDVDEKGSEAAAVTVAEMMDSACPREEILSKATFHANRPFIYLITDNMTGIIYFIGMKRK
jgi:serine protease inhibitor